MRCDFVTTTYKEGDVSLKRQVVSKKNFEKNLGSIIQIDKYYDKNIKHRIKEG